MALVRGSTFLSTVTLDGWSLACSPGEQPADLETAEWLPIGAETTVAAALKRHGRWSFDTPRAFDDETWWFRARIPAFASASGRGGPGAGTKHVLRLGGLATIADVFIDRQKVLHSENMYEEHLLDLDALGLGSGDHELLIRFGALNPALGVKRPRPRWKTRLASHQQLRWIRTSLVGRMPGWSPPVPAVGPWRPVVLETWDRARVSDVVLRASVEGAAGIVRFAARFSSSAREVRATLHVGEHAAALEVERSGDHTVVKGQVAVANPKLWWPHTHGSPERYPARVTLEVDGKSEAIELGHVAFRSISVDTSDRGFSLHINGVPIFCRGGCWTTADVTTLTTTREEYARVLGTVRDAGMNMLRMSGTLFYEADDFYETCDALGILVWQDFMFANMDYPDGDEGFRASVDREVAQVLGRLQSHPSVVVLCGGSEVEQQAAMFGAARGIWRAKLFGEILPAAVEEHCPGLPYVPSSPSGGALPFHVDEGVSHYYGVGAYLRPFDDARRARVRFATESLCFANVPEDDLLPMFLAEGQAPFVHAKWKERTSKDNGSAWDFEDVRDHYTALLFGVDPMRVRYQDVNRYLTLSRVTTGEVMARVYAEFRRRDSTCKGALIWFLQDLWPGAGWGVLDSRGRPKAAWWFLKRSLQPLGLFITDEGVNGLHLHVVNDRAEDLTATLKFTLYRDGEFVTHRGETEVSVGKRAAIEVAGDALLETFADTAHAYRFGPPGHDVVVASLVDKSGTLLAETTYLLDFAHPPPCSGIEGTLTRGADGTLLATIRTKRFAHAVMIAVPNYLPDDNYFDLAPGAEKTVVLRPVAESKRAPSGELTALNLKTPARLLLSEP